MHLAYFSSYALWIYLTIPFLYTYPGFVTEELGPWEESGEQWRPLKVIVPDSIASHSREQVAYFGPDGLLRRHEYTVDIMGGAAGQITPLTIATSTESWCQPNGESTHLTAINRKFRLRF
jgi:hypothetical protein